MNDSTLRRHQSDYPTRCPECGRKAAVRPPGLGGMMWLGGWFCVGFVGKAISDYGRFGTVQALTPSVMAAIAVVGLYSLFRKCGGERIRKRGFVLCDRCGWIRIGEESGPRVARLRERGHALFRGIAISLVAPGLFFLGLTFFGDPTASIYLLGSVWLVILASAFATVFTPVRRYGANDHRTRFGGGPPRG